MIRVLLLVFSISLLSTNVLSQEGEGLLTFKDGKIGVNFFGYKASAGLGGHGNSGGLFASAETPFGQKASAGGGGINSDRGSAGGLFAGAQSGYGQKASAGLGGLNDRNGGVGGLFAHSDSGYGQESGAGLLGSNRNDVNNGIRNFLNQLFQ